MNDDTRQQKRVADNDLPRRLRRIAADWKLRAVHLDAAGAKVSASFLRECAGEIEAAIESREPKRTSWFKHEHNDGRKTN